MKLINGFFAGDFFKRFFADRVIGIKNFTGFYFCKEFI